MDGSFQSGWEDEPANAQPSDEWGDLMGYPKERKCGREGCENRGHWKENELCRDCETALTLGLAFLKSPPVERLPYWVDTPYVRAIRYNKRDTVRLPRFGYLSAIYKREDYGNVEDIIKEVISSLREPETLRFSTIEKEWNHRENKYYAPVVMDPRGDRFPRIFEPEKRIDYCAPLVELPSRTVELLRVLRKSLESTIQACYDQGYKDGRDLLRAIVEGRLSIDDMNKMSMGVED